MSVEIKVSGETVTAYLSGELDHHSARAMREAIDNAVELNMPSRLVLNFRNISFMDSSGIAVLLRAWKRMGQVRGAMRVVHTPPQAEKVFRAAGLQRIIRFEPGERPAGRPAPRG